MSILETCALLVERVREEGPLVHHLTNYVTVNDCANVTLAIGGSPIMADAIEEVADIAALASALVLNIGTLNARMIDSMLAAGKRANSKGIPVVLDPVGAGASAFRTSTALRLLAEVKIAAIRGNISEVRSLAGLAAHTKGVDADSADEAFDAGEVAAGLARKQGCVVAVTGARDAISNGSRIVFVDNGVPALSRVSGTGCMCSSLVGSFVGTAPEMLLEGTAAAILCMGIAGELASEKTGASGTGSYRAALMDAVSRMDRETMMRRGRISETEC